MRNAILVLTILTILAVPCFGATINVNWDGTGDHTTIQAGINAAVNGDTVIVADGTYTGSGNKGIDFKGKAITVMSENGLENCVIDCENSNRGFNFISGEGPDSILKGFAITNGYIRGKPAIGGSMYIANSSPTIENCVITNNRAYGDNAFYINERGGFAYGGGVYTESGSNPYFVNCSILNNTAKGGYGDGGYGGNGGGYARGGGIYGAATLEKCTISNNTARAGDGGDDGEGGSPGAAFGGGLWFTGSIIDSVITGNQAVGGSPSGPHEVYGGGIYCYNGATSIVNCLIADNDTANGMEWGDGIYVSSNVSTYVTITNCTIVDNYDDYGGGIVSNSSNSTITDCIIWGNGDDLLGGSATYSCIEDLDSGVGNIHTDPCFVTGPLGDYYLSQTAAGQATNSPCMDTGSDTAVNLGMDIYMTRTDKVWDIGIVDMGYHYVGYIIDLDNITASQRMDGSDLVDIYYDLGGADLFTISVEVSNDGGSTWDVIAVSLTGDIGSDITPYTGKHIIWDWGADLPGEYGTNYRIKVIADDSYGDTGSGLSNIFAIDIAPPVIGLSPAAFQFSCYENGLNPADQILNITNVCGGTLYWEIGESCDWLDVSPDSGSSTGEPNEVVLSVDISGLAWGNYYYCELTITDPNAENNPQIVSVNLNMDSPIIDLSATSFEFTSSSVEGLQDQILTITNTGGYTLDWTITETCDWLTVNPYSGVSIGEPNDVTLSVDVSNLNHGDYSCMLSITDPNAENNPQTVDVTLHVVPVVLNYNAQTYAYAYSDVYGADPDSETDQDFSVNQQCISLAYAFSDSWEWACPQEQYMISSQASNTECNVNGVHDSSGSVLISEIEGWGTWNWYDECTGSAGSRTGGGSGNGNTSLSGTMEIGIFQNYPAGSPGLILNLDATLAGDIPASWDNWDWWLKVWDTDPDNPLVMLNDVSMSAELDILAGQILNFELYHEAEEDDDWPEAGLGSTLTINLTVRHDFDIDGSGCVDLVDFAILCSQWQDVPGVPSADIAPEGGDNFVDLQDLLMLTENWPRP